MVLLESVEFHRKSIGWRGRPLARLLSVIFRWSCAGFGRFLDGFLRGLAARTHTLCVPGENPGPYGIFVLCLEAENKHFGQSGARRRVGFKVVVVMMAAAPVRPQK